MASYEGPFCVEKQEMPELIDLLNLVFRPKGGDMGREYPRHAAWSNRENVRIIKENGRIVSHVATSIRPICLNGISTWEAGIGAVATHPNGRGKGYASILMQDAVERSVEQGADIMLISGDLGVYRRMHAVDCGIYPVVKIEGEDLQESRGFFISEWKEEDLDEAIELWKTLPTRYLLPREDWQALSQCKHVMDKPSQWWTVRLDNELAGFGIIHQKDAELTLLDWAGRPKALEAAAAFWLKKYGANQLTYIPSSSTLLPLHWKRHIATIRTFEGTVLIIHAQRFLERAQAFLRERIGEEALSRLQIDAEKQRVRFGWGKEQASFDNGGELALLFFGHPTLDIVAEKLGGDSELAALLNKMFPTPLVWYGIGYV